MPDDYPPPCIHAASGLCPDCRDAYEEDPSGYLDYGDHPAGLARWQALQAEIAADSASPESRAESQESEDDLPF
jgi:hypothetical protein